MAKIVKIDVGRALLANWKCSDILPIEMSDEII